MSIVIIAGKEQQDAWDCTGTDITWINGADDFNFAAYTNAAAFIFLTRPANYDFSKTVKPVFINSVTTTLQELGAGRNVLRINGWPGFLERPTWEIAGNFDDAAAMALEKLHKKPALVKDTPGLVSAKIIAMIINEAYFALGDAVSSEKEIDIAMKLGTNYPYGPFEWAKKIGIKNIADLLQQLSINDNRYIPAAKLLEAVQ